MNATAPADLDGPRRGVAIVGLGHHSPARIVTSAALEADLGLPAGWIVRRTGIHARRWVGSDEATSDIAMRAADHALTAAQAHGVLPDDIALVLLATSTPDHLLPPTAPLLAHRLGLTAAGGVDLAGACSGFLYALVLADGFVRAQARPVLVVAANVLSRRIDPADRNSAVLFADAGGAVVLAPSPRADAGLSGLHLTASGGGYGLIHIPAGGSRQPFAADTAVVDTRMVMADGRAVYAEAVAMMTNSARIALARAGVAAADVAHVVAHQANARLIETVRTSLAIPPSRMLSTVADYGNSSAATIPFTLSYANADGRTYADGDLVLMTAAGAGLVGGALVWRW